MTPVAVYLREQVEDGTAVYAANAVHEFDAIEAERLVAAGVGVLASDLAPAPAPESSAAAMASLQEAYDNLQAAHDTVMAELHAANTTITQLTSQVAELQKDLAAAKKPAKDAAK